NENFFRRPAFEPGGGEAGAAAGAPGGPPGPPGAPRPAPPPPPGPGGPGAARPGGMAGAGAMGMGGGFLSTVRAQIIRADDPVSLWGTHWLGYTRWDCIVVTVGDMDDLRRGTRDARAVLAALWQYAEAGGSLVVLGPGQPPVPASWKRNTAQLPGFTVYRPGF